jgi:hypothetical protein
VTTGLTAENIVTGEMLGVIEHWFSDDDATHVLLANPVGSCPCGEMHTWFVNRDGRTLCIDCDLWRTADLAKHRRQAGVTAVREAFRLFRQRDIPGKGNSRVEIDRSRS